MRKADFKSTRGKFTFNVNHTPIENFYLLKAVKAISPDPIRYIIDTSADADHGQDGMDAAHLL